MWQLGCPNISIAAIKEVEKNDKLKIKVLIADGRNSPQELYRDNRAERKKKYGSWIINGKLKVSCININHVVSTIGLVR